MIKAEILLDSKSPWGDRLTTFVLTYPRFIHAELMTHREFSRNASSSRAISVERLLGQIEESPAGPLEFGAERPGMQADERLNTELSEKAQENWDLACEEASYRAEVMASYGVHKQVVNRLLEPFSHITVIVSSTKWSNFFSLRCSEDAQPEMRHLAYLMLRKYYESVPTRLKVGEWHLPFIGPDDGNLDLETKKKVSVARCARVSYLNHEGKRDIEKDLALHDRLLADGHMSAFEHVAMCIDSCIKIGNFTGWLQYRKMIPTEYRDEDKMPPYTDTIAYFCKRSLEGGIRGEYGKVTKVNPKEDK